MDRTQPLDGSTAFDHGVDVAVGVRAEDGFPWVRAYGTARLSDRRDQVLERPLDKGDPLAVVEAPERRRHEVV